MGGPVGGAWAAPPPAPALKGGQRIVASRRFVQNRAMRPGLRLVVVGVLACSCKFPELPAVDPDASLDATGQLDASRTNVVITGGPSQDSTTGPRVVFEFSVADGQPLCRFDNGALTPCQSPIAANLSSGIHTFHVQAENSAGSIDFDTRLWSVACRSAEVDAMSFAMFHFDEPSGDGNLTSAPNPRPEPARHGTLGGGGPEKLPLSFTPGRFGSGALRFRAMAVSDSDYVTISPLVGVPAMSVGAHAMEMWLNPTVSFAHELDVLATLMGTQAGRMDYRISFNREGTQGRFKLTVRDSGNEQVANSQVVSFGTYHYVGFSYTPGERPFLFVDGVKSEVAQAVTGTVAQFNLDTTGPYEGDLDELHMTFRPMAEADFLERWCPP